MSTATADDLVLRVSVEYAGRWYAGLLKALDGLAFMPQRFPLARESEQRGRDVRRLLYHGPTGRRGSSVYRILFLIVEPALQEDEGVVRVLHVWHGSRADA
jgi:hypothetical protein